MASVTGWKKNSKFRANFTDSTGQKRSLAGYRAYKNPLRKRDGFVVIVRDSKTNERLAIDEGRIVDQRDILNNPSGLERAKRPKTKKKPFIEFKKTKF